MQTLINKSLNPWILEEFHAAYEAESFKPVQLFYKRWASPVHVTVLNRFHGKCFISESESAQLDHNFRLARPASYKVQMFRLLR